MVDTDVEPSEEKKKEKGYNKDNDTKLKWEQLVRLLLFFVTAIFRLLTTSG